MSFATKQLPAARDVVAPDGSDVRILLDGRAGGMAHFTLAPGVTSRAIVHRTVEEIWYVVSGRGEMWRQDGTHEDVVALEPGTCLTIPTGTRFQFRALGDAPLCAIGVTMPRWPGPDEARFVDGPWPIKASAG